MPAVGRATGTNEAIFAASQTAAAGLGMSDPAMVPPPAPRRRGAAVYVGIGFVAIALIVVAAIVLSSGGEDAGWLMGFVHDDATNATRFAVLDATNLAAGPVAQVTLPQRAPYGFHGNWFAD